MYIIYYSIYYIYYISLYIICVNLQFAYVIYIIYIYIFLYLLCLLFIIYYLCIYIHMNVYVVMSDPRHRVLNLTEVDGHNIYVIKRTMWPLGYHHNGFVSATHALGPIKNVNHVLKSLSCHKAIAVITGRAHCFHDYKYI